MRLGLGIRVSWSSLVRSAVPNLINTLQARATYSENITCTTATLTALENIK
jgi:hypothetical protein